MLKTLSGFHVYLGGHVANILVLIFGRKHLFSENFGAAHQAQCGVCMHSWHVCLLIQGFMPVNLSGGG